jgi:hypothetical protein
MSENSSGTLPAELYAFPLPLAAAVACKLGFASFEPMSEDEIRKAITQKDAESLALMDNYFQRFLECGRSPNSEMVQARDEARFRLVARTVEISQKHS